METGKEKCERLKAIRKHIAEQYGLEYVPTECTHKGECTGTCPKCDAELCDLQEQLDKKGIKEIDLNVEIPIQGNGDDTTENADIHILQGEVAAPKLPLEGMPTPPFIPKRKIRVLYKECHIAGTTFHNLEDVWDELYGGAKLALVREKGNLHDRNAVAVALADDYDGDPENFDFDYILGYVPRTENTHIAMMQDMGWAETFECELSRIEGDNPRTGKLYMKIYIVSKEEVEITDHLLRAMELDDEEFADFLASLLNQGCTYFRWGGFPPWERNLPKKKDKVVFIHRLGNEADLYLMYCIAVGDDDAAYFVEEKELLHAVDDCCFYVFTIVKGFVTVACEQLDFLNGEPIESGQPEAYLSESASGRLYELFGIEKPKY